ncbi:MULTISPECIES: ABC transporter ATP-binding protein [Caproicibacterium]|uniref:ATP-binding cassette domain-containing protein n=2 Tax=Caproicibacterium lactatifermentans TaxID=2666138 RepID=A0A859DVM3_9FIRM|nr:ABC transporter ATP-binding protein [Caproicibacterium lactatifermentans]ARP49896.1 heme ABC transporter ATP-binding protein [Ruminococcaceae bacterium CPB6]QKN24383.1 ATP-binding cassette domain-containing protein [Caproicibacterium lactatifermentans]
MEVSSEYAVQMRGITKYFGTFCALDHVDLNVKKGTIHSLLGENGAGKSTLMNVLYGLYQADEGEIYLNGKKADITSPNVAIAHGIGMVHQHFMLVDNFTVTQNIILGNETTSHFGVLNMKKARKDVKNLVKKYGLEVDPDAKVEDISVGMQQRVEILKALYRGADLLILDEPTAVLTPQEIDDLIKILHNLIADGKTIIIITHKLKEIKASSSTCTIIRRGKYIDTVNVADCDEEDLASKMVGHAVQLVVQKTPAKPGKTVFEIDNLHVKDERGLPAVNDLSLKVHAGEIVGLAGIDGNGQKELVEAITNLCKTESGTIRINGTEIQNTTPYNTVHHKVATIHEDRQRRGLVMDFSVKENMVLEKYNQEPFCHRGLLNRGEIASYTKDLIKDYDIRPADCVDEPARGLSGGNQQKVIIAREVANEPDLLIAVQPTRGLDVGAIEYVHKTLIRERDHGCAILLVSLELDEIMSVSDTISVLYKGQIAGSFKQGEVDEKTIGLLMAGGKLNG